jgi:hypothetical protein
MTDWATISSLATAGGTLVLALATFSSVRSANRAARAAERSLLAGLRPLLMPSRLQDPPEKITFTDGFLTRIDGGHGVVEVTDEVIYLAASLRNAGNGIAVLHGWMLYPSLITGEIGHEPPSGFRRLTRDIYVPAGDLGFWQGALRDSAEPAFATTAEAARRGELTVDLLYGDHEGGQRMVSRFSFRLLDTGVWLVAVTRHWNLDRHDPRAD